MYIYFIVKTYRDERIKITHHSKSAYTSPLAAAEFRSGNAEICHVLRSSSDPRHARRRRIDREEERHCRSCRRRRIGFWISCKHTDWNLGRFIHIPISRLTTVQPGSQRRPRALAASRQSSVISRRVHLSNRR